MARHREVAADLVRAARLDADGEVRGLRVGAEAVDLREGAAAVERQVDRRGGGVPAAVDDRAVGLGDAVLLEDGDDGRVRGGGLGEQDAARGVAVEAVRGAKLRVAGLLSQERLEREGGLVHEDAAGLVGDEEVGVLEEDLRPVRALGDGGGGVDDAGDRDDRAGAEPVVRHPDGLAVHADDAGVDLLLGGAARDAELRGEELLEGGAVLRPRHPEGHGAARWCSAHAAEDTRLRRRGQPRLIIRGRARILRAHPNTPPPPHQNESQESP